MYDKPNRINALGEPVGCCGPAPAVRAPVAEEVVAFANRLAARAEDLSRMVGDKLTPITSVAPPATGQGNGPVPEYPPLFDVLRQSLTSIECSLNYIGETMNRVEL